MTRPPGTWRGAATRSGSRSIRRIAPTSSACLAPLSIWVPHRRGWWPPWARRYSSGTMSLDKAPSSSRDASPMTANGSAGASTSKSLAAAGFFVAWLIYVAIFAGVFSFSGISPAMALRGAVANALPDGLLALAVIAATNRLSWPETDRWRFSLLNIALAATFAILATAAKTALLWLDSLVVGRPEPFRLSPPVIAWQIFISLLVYGAVAGGAYAQANARRLRQAAAA